MAVPAIAFALTCLSPLLAAASKDGVTIENQMASMLAAMEMGSQMPMEMPMPVEVPMGPFGGERSGKGKHVGGGSLDDALLEELFPGSIVVELEDSPQSGFDPMIEDMLREVEEADRESFARGVRHRSWGDRHQACKEDLTKHCKDNKHQLHCLGKHAEDVSPACRDNVGKSVPFLCSADIDMLCDTLQSGILPCLEGQTSRLSGDCLDAVQATRKVVTPAAMKSAPAVGTPAAPAGLARREVGAENTPIAKPAEQPWMLTSLWRGGAQELAHLVEGPAPGHLVADLREVGADLPVAYNSAEEWGFRHFATVLAVFVFGVVLYALSADQAVTQKALEAALWVGKRTSNQSDRKPLLGEHRMPGSELSMTKLEELEPIDCRASF